MLSFRVDEVVAATTQAWADRLGIDRSELLREALRHHLLRLASEIDTDERVANAPEWGPAEDWSDWADAAG